MIHKMAIIAAILAFCSSATHAETDRLPSLYLNPAIIAKLQSQIIHDPNYISLWRETQKSADNLLKTPPKPQPPGDSSKDASFAEGYLHGVGDNISLLAFVYKISGDKKHLAACRQWAEAALTYSPWGRLESDGGDLAPGHLLSGLALAYNWLGPDLGSPLREKVRQALLTHGRFVYAGATKPNSGWARLYLQNHMWVAASGLAIAALALKGEDGINNGEMDQWLDFAKKNFAISASLFSQDGFSQEGLGYWSYGVERLLRFMDLAKDHLDLDLLHPPGGTEPLWWRNAPLYRKYLSLPKNSQTKSGRNGFIVDFGDLNRRRELFGALVMRKLAQEYKDPVAQQVANEAFQSDVVFPGGDFWLHLLWSDFSVPASSLKDLPTIHLFDNMGVISTRSSWSGDESLLVFKCGAPMGHEAVANNLQDGGKRYLSYFASSAAHVHPDANSFCLFGAGNWLIRTSAGIPQNGRLAKNENTLRVDGHGQFSDGDVWFQGNKAVTMDPKISIVHTDDTYNYLLGDATSAYDKKLQLTRFQRHLIYLKKLNIVLILDDIQLSKPATLNLDFHPEYSPTPEHAANGVVDVWQTQDPAKKTTLRLAELDPAAKSSSGIYSFNSTNPTQQDQQLQYISIERPNISSWQNAMALSWAAGKNSPPIIAGTHSSDPSIWNFVVNGETKPVTITVNAADHTVEEIK